MYLAARHLKTCSNRSEALAVISLLDGVKVVAMSDDGRGSGVELLDVETNTRGNIQRLHIILVTRAAGVDICAASGLHLSATAEGARLAFADGCIDQIIDDDSERPVACYIFQFNYGGDAHAFH